MSTSSLESDGCCCYAGVGWPVWTFRARQTTLDRDSFETVVTFLASVPLFKTQLPRSELPKVAQQLVMKAWAPGSQVVRQGATGRAFFLIKSGEAVVSCVTADGTDKQLAYLSPGDWIGGHCLTAERPNVATVTAKGPAYLVTLSMSKRAFETCGLKSHLKIPKRPAMHASMYRRSGRHGGDKPPSREDMSGANSLSLHEQEFIVGALKRNANLRAFCGALNSDTVLRSIAANAEKRHVSSGTVLARQGDVGSEFFIISEGSLRVLAHSVKNDEHWSVEAAMAHFSMAERLRRKQSFMAELYKPMQNGTKRRATCGVTAAPVQGNGTRWYSGRTGRTNDSTSSSTTHDSPRSPLSPKVPSSSRPPSWTGNKGKKSSMPNGTGGESSSALVDRPLSPRKRGPDCGDALVTLGSQDSFGELSLLYNTRREATVEAVEDSVVFALRRHHFRKLIARDSPRIKEYWALLGEVDVLMPLLQSERWDLACSVSDFVTFGPKQRILHQGKPRAMSQWYIIHSGSARLVQDTTEPDGSVQTRVLGEFGRASYFGERSMMRKGSSSDAQPEASVDAGEHGVTCLTFDGALIFELFDTLTRLRGEAISFPALSLDIAEWARSKQQRCTDRRPQSATPGNLGDLRRLQCVGILGEGGFGRVFLVYDPFTEKRCAVKRISKGWVRKEKMLNQVIWERDLMSMLDSRFIIHLSACYKDEQFFYLQMEAALGGDLWEVTSKHPRAFYHDAATGSIVRFFAACILSALEHLHERKIAFRDLKLENVLLDSNGYGKLCDMGLARFIIGSARTFCGTADYMAPEMIDPPHKHDVNVDWWGLGVLSYELTCGQTPFDDDGMDSQEQRALAIRRNQETGDLWFPPVCPIPTQDFIARLLQKLPYRLGAQGGANDLREHIFFTEAGFSFEALYAGKLRCPLLAVGWKPKEPALQPNGKKLTELEEGDRIFVPCVDDRSSWDHSF